MRVAWIDPPDPSGYAQRDLNSTAGGWPDGGYPYKANDNKGNTDRGLMKPLTDAPADFLELNMGTDGLSPIFYLKVPDDYSGDNFQIAVYECRYQGPCLTDRPMYLTPIYTSWKRIFVERDKMFRKGGLLYQDYDPATCFPRCDQITLFAGANIDLGDEIVVFDEVNTYESGGERAVVTGLAAQEGGSIVVTMDRFLSKKYSASSRDMSTPANPTFANGHSGGVGVISGCDPDPNQINTQGPLPSCFYEADLRGIEPAFGDAFVQFLAPRSGMSAVPTLPASFFGGYQMKVPEGTCQQPVTEPVRDYDFKPMRRFGWIWFTNAGRPNYIALIGAGEVTQLSDANGPCIQCSQNRPLPVYLGLTFAENAVSYVHRGAIEEYCDKRAGQFHNCTQEITNHEEGHEFYVNHDSRCHWMSVGPLLCSDPDPVCNAAADGCLMNSAGNPWDFRHRFDRFDLTCGDPACTNPVDPKPGCCTAGQEGCTLPGDGTIRHLSDPIQGVSPPWN